MSKIAFRVDGGSNLGYGHIMRCLSLAEELNKEHEIYFITKKNKNLIDILNDYNIIFLNKNINIENEINKIKNSILKFKIDVLILDIKNIEKKYLFSLKEKCFLIGISLNEKLHEYLDLLINDNIYSIKGERNFNKRKSLLGPNYKLMRKEFQDIPKRKLNYKVNQIMISTGGGDPNNFTPEILKLLNKGLNRYMIFKVVVGPGFNNVSNIVNVANEIENQTELIFNINKISKLMLNSDIAIVAGGTTLYEVAATGTPSIAILQAENQIENARHMKEEGIILNLGYRNDINYKEFIQALNKLKNNFKLRKLMSKKGQLLVDGYGAKRCAEHINIIINNKKS